jgi:glycosyltransferase involved in cell wall biosynthesis
MKLQILIPQYKETDNIIKPLLDSIAIQQGVDLINDIGIIIVNDGTEVHLSNNLLNSYPFKIDYYLHEHKGVSATRNACLDYATADYVMFCDADDMFYNACGLYIIFREIDKNEFDSLVSVFIEEVHKTTEPGPSYITHPVDSTFVHGKVHRRQYLIDKNIRWDETLTLHEDGYFNCLCQRLSNNVKYCQTPFYLWRWRDDSVCRSGGDFVLRTYDHLLDSNTALVNEFIRRNMYKEAQFYAVGMIYNAYFTLNKDEWLTNDTYEHRLKVEKRFQKFYNDFKYLYDSISLQEKNQIIMMLKTKMFAEGLMLESITFDEWIKKIENL